MNSIKRGVKKNQDTTEVAFFDIKTMKDELSVFKNDYLEFKEEIRTKLAAFGTKTPDASDFFPTKDNATLERFMVKDDLFKNRKESLYLLLYGCASDNQKNFCDGFINAVFTREYCTSHVWPYGR